MCQVEDAAAVYAGLRDRGVSAWVWHGDGFAAPDHVVFVPPAFMDLRPFVYGVAAELLPFSALLTGAGVTQTARLVDVLNKVVALVITVVSAI